MQQGGFSYFIGRAGARAQGLCPWRVMSVSKSHTPFGLLPSWPRHIFPGLFFLTETCISLQQVWPSCDMDTPIARAVVHGTLWSKKQSSRSSRGRGSVGLNLRHACQKGQLCHCSEGTRSGHCKVQGALISSEQVQSFILRFRTACLRSLGFQHLPLATVLFLRFTISREPAQGRMHPKIDPLPGSAVSSQLSTNSKL